VIYLKLREKLLKAADVHPKKQVALSVQQRERPKFEDTEGFYDLDNIDPLLSPEDFKV
jgi:hypothetical protein